MRSVKATNKFYVYGLFANNALIYVGRLTMVIQTLKRKAQS